MPGACPSAGGWAAWVQRLPGTCTGVSDLQATILALLDDRAPEASICPSEAARAAAGEEWRELMAAVRSAAADLADAGRIVVTQHGRPVDVRTARGPVRLRRT